MAAIDELKQEERMVLKRLDECDSDTAYAALMRQLRAIRREMHEGAPSRTAISDLLDGIENVR